MPQRNRHSPRLIRAAALAGMAVVLIRRSPQLRWTAVVFASAALWAAFPPIRRYVARSSQALGWRLRRRREQRNLAARAMKDAELRVSEEGVSFAKDPRAGLVPWSEIAQVELYWEENPWGDPQFGRYSDFFWRITTRAPGSYTVADTDVNRFVLLPGLTRHLPGYSFVYEQFKAPDWDGSTVCWKRSD